MHYHYLNIFIQVKQCVCFPSRVADMLEVVGERVGNWCGRDARPSSLAHLARTKRRQHQSDVYSKIENERAVCTFFYTSKWGHREIGWSFNIKLSCAANSLLVAMQTHCQKPEQLSSKLYIEKTYHDKLRFVQRSLVTPRLCIHKLHILKGLL